MQRANKAGSDGDEPADPVDFLEQLYGAAANRLVVVAYALTSDLSEAQDVVHEAFLRVMKRPGQVVRADNPMAYMRTITLNIARERYRRRQRLKVLMRRVAADEQPLPGLTPDRAALVTAIRQLPLKQRQSIALFYLSDMTVEEVAEALRAPTGSVKAWLSRGRKALAALLGDEEADRKDAALIRGATRD